MTRAVVSELALRELLREALDNTGAMGHDASAPVVPNPATDRTTLELDFDPVEVRHAPRNRNELVIMVRNLLDTVEDEQSGELYRKIKAMVGGDQVGKKDFAKATEVPPTMGNEENGQMKEGLVEAIRNIVEETLNEALPFGFGKGKMKLGGQFQHPHDEEEGPQDDFIARGGSVEDEFKADGTVNFNPDEDISDPEELEAVLARMTKSAWDPDDEEDEEEVVPAPKGSPRKRVDAGTGYGVDGDTFEKIGEKFGFTKEAAKKAVETAMERFRVLHAMDPEDMAEMVLDGVDDYIDMLAKTGELTDDDEAFLRLNPTHVAESDTFREFFSKYVKKAAREDRADSQDDEG